jgi:SnoaL-like domain
MTTQEKNIALATQVYHYFNQHEWDKMTSLYAEVATFKDPAFGTEIVQQSRLEIAQKYKEMADMFPDLHDEIIAVYPCADTHVIVEFVSSGTSPDGIRWRLPICTIFTIEQGIITKDFTYYDNSQN